MSNHLGDTNKMVSDTPRTEAEVNRQKCWSDDLITIDANFACQLERELNAANDRIKRLEEFVEQLTNPKFTRDDLPKEALLQRIKRLEEALEGTVKWIVHLADSGDAGFWDVEKQSEIIAARAALKKESKP